MTLQTSDTEVIKADETYTVQRRVIVEIVRTDGGHCLFSVPDDDDDNALAVAFGETDVEPESHWDHRAADDS